MTTMCHKNYAAQQNTINQREGFPGTAAANLWHWAGCLFFIRHIWRQSIHPRSIYVTALVLSWRSITHTYTCRRSSFPPHIPNLMLIAGCAVLDSSTDLWLGCDPDWAVEHRERERKMRRGSTPSESIQIWRTSRCYMSKYIFWVWRDQRLGHLLPEGINEKR